MSDYKVYLLRCPISQQVRYIGITRQDIYRRYDAHLRDGTNKLKTEWIKELKSKNKKPIIELLKDNLSFVEANELEQKAIKKYDKKNYLTNSFVNGRHRASVGGANKRAVLQYSKDGKFIKKYSSVTAAAQQIGKKSRTNLSDCLNGKTKTAYGFIWKYEKDKFNIKSFLSKSQLIGQFSIDNKCLAIYTNVSAASKVTGVDASDIRKCCKGKRNKVLNYFWKYINF